ncbi:hypothetical protein U2S91_08240 [Stenotrophomonas maltophilia]|nr:hypothetical protein [Stenotrophomonas maltophilia]WQI22613.1 hypothetical protein U2S91_08240 [Stenotrophomonas maltophilia]
MAEIIIFPQRMRFTALRAFDIHSGLGSVVGVLWAPEQCIRRRSYCSEQEHDHPALAELKAATSQPVAAVPDHPAVPSNREG